MSNWIIYIFSILFLVDIILNFFLIFALFFLHHYLFKLVILYKNLNHNTHYYIFFDIANNIQICIQRKSCDYFLHFFLSILYNLDTFLQFYFFSILQNHDLLFLHNLLFYEAVLNKTKIMTKITFYIFIIFFFLHTHHNLV